MEIVCLKKGNTDHCREAAALLAAAFPHSYKDCAEEEVNTLLAEGKIALVALDQGHVAGLVGAMPQYGKTGQEMHPLAVAEEHQSRGIGSALLSAVETECRHRGGVTIYLGTDDEFGKTSLSGCDLYENIYEKMESARNFKGHPFSFYQKNGYKIVGVIPDANGVGKPDIYMAKRL